MLGLSEPCEDETPTACPGETLGMVWTIHAGQPEKEKEDRTGQAITGGRAKSASSNDGCCFMGCA